MRNYHTKMQCLLISGVKIWGGRKQIWGGCGPPAPSTIPTFLFYFRPPQIVTCSSASDNYIPFSRFGQTVDYSQQQTVTMQSVPYSDVQVPLSTHRQIPFKLQYRVTAVLTGTCQEPVLAGINLRLVATQCRPVLLISEKKRLKSLSAFTSMYGSM